MACPCAKKVTKDMKPQVEQRPEGYVVKDATGGKFSACEHGVSPWYNCETCSEQKTYSFNGNFR